MRTWVATVMVVMSMVTLQAEAAWRFSFFFEPRPPAPPPVAPVQPTPEAPPRYEALADYGVWFHLEPYGLVWQPYAAQRERGWDPYRSNGRWEGSREERRWSSRYAWGETPYQSGRWFQCPQRGWVWIPEPVYITPPPEPQRPPVIHYYREPPERPDPRPPVRPPVVQQRRAEPTRPEPRVNRQPPQRSEPRPPQRERAETDNRSTATERGASRGEMDNRPSVPSRSAPQRDMDNRPSPPARSAPQGPTDRPEPSAQDQRTDAFHMQGPSRR